MLVMDLLFRGVYEDRRAIYRHQELHQIVTDHSAECTVSKKADFVQSIMQLPFTIH